MVANVPVIEAGELRKLVEELSATGEQVPMPERVEIVPSEDHDGEPVWIARIVYPASMPASTLPWHRLSPLVQRLGALVFERGGEERFVLIEIKRLAEAQPGDS